MNTLSPLTILLGSYGLLTLSAGFLMLKKPPKKINPFYGYRTRLSMSSQENWDFAQVYSSKEMIRQGLAFIGLGIISLFTGFNEMTSMIFALLLIIGSVILLLYKTEKKLKQNFNNET